MRLILLPLVVIASMALLVFSLSRAALLLVTWPRASEVDAVEAVLLQGLRQDFFTVLVVVAIPLFLLPLLATSRMLLPIWKVILVWYGSVAIAMVVFLEIATPSFIGMFDARPNLHFIEYLEYPKEIGQTVWLAYRLPLCVALVAVVFGFAFTYRCLHRLLKDAQSMPPTITASLCVVLVLGSGLALHPDSPLYPDGPVTRLDTPDSLVNQLGLNSLYNVGHAAYRMRLEEKGGARYGDMKTEEAMRIVRQSMHIPTHRFLDQISSWHSLSPSKVAMEDSNLVVILEESLSARFVGSLGGLNLTPELDTLASQGIWFEQLFATGTRSVRGIEAVISGFLPTQARSVVKLKKSQSDFFSLAGFLADRGYDTSFFYGGNADFDNMRSFFQGNGITRIIDREAFISPSYVGTWGVCDDDVLTQAHQEFMRLQAVKRPFFSLIFTTSNHTPFQFPKTDIELYRQPVNSVENSVRYADHALGRFFDRARLANYWENTVFLIVSDHNERVRGNSLIPIESYHIPGLIIGKDIEPLKIESIVSQIDLAPTLLALMGHDGAVPMPGRDINAMPESDPGRAIMQFNEIQAYREGDFVAVLEPNKEPRSFLYREGGLIPSRSPDIELIEKAIAHATWASDVYQNRGYSSKVNEHAYSR